MKKIIYYTTVKSIKRRLKESAPMGFDVEVINIKPLSHLKETNSIAFRFHAIRNWKKADIVHYVTDRDDFIKRGGSKTLRGRHHRFWGTSYCRSFVRKDWWVKFDKGDDTANDSRHSGDMKQLEYTVYHENLHALSDILDKKDKLHEWVGLGKFMDYERDYLGRTDYTPKDLLPLVKKKAEGIVLIMKLLNKPVRITSGYRSIAEQNKLYAQGRTTNGNIVTNAKGGESLHNYGVAVDFVFIDKGYNAPQEDWKWLGIIGKALGFEWGGDWKIFKDKPHFEMKLDYKLKDFQSGKVDYTKWD